MTNGSDTHAPRPGDRAKNPGLLLARPFGVPVYVTSSWLIIAALITVVYGGIVEGRLGLGGGSYLLAFVFALLLYASVLVHELAHAVVARLYGLPVRRIVLYVLGGVSEIEREAPSPGREFMIAFAGPALSLVLAAGAFALSLVATPFTVTGELLFQLWIANFLVGVFNLLPGLPLDGGRLLRAAVWKLTGRPFTGSVAGAWGGRVLALLVVAAPFAFAWSAGQAPGPWPVVWGLVLGGFLWMGATESLRAARMRSRVPGLRARELARPAVAVTADTSLAEAERRAAQAGATAIVVVDAVGTPVSIVHPGAAQAITDERKAWVPAPDVARAVNGDSVVPVDAEGAEFLEQLTRHPLPEYIVVGEDGGLHGVLRSVDINAAVSGKR